MDDPRMASMANLLSGYKRGEGMSGAESEAPSLDPIQMMEMLSIPTQNMQAAELPQAPRSAMPDMQAMMRQMQEMQGTPAQGQQGPDMMSMMGSGGMPTARLSSPALTAGTGSDFAQGLMAGGQSLTQNLMAQNKQRFESMRALMQKSEMPDTSNYKPDKKLSGAKGLGSVSSKYESNGDPGTIARTKGDIGGASYGAFQLTKASGQAQKFANQYGGPLKGLKVDTPAFDKAWKAEAKKNPEKFKQAQQEYMVGSHYQPAVNNIKKKTGFDASKYPKAVQEMVMSIGIQHGAGGAATVFKNAGVNNKMSAEQVIKKVYNERMRVGVYFKSSPKNIQQSVKNRFQKELKDVLSLL